MQDIVANGLDSIRIGLEDFEQSKRESARLTSAVRNIYAGILLLAKGKLYELSPPDSNGILIRIVKPQLVGGRLEMMPQGRKTIGYEEIKERLKHFRLELDWKRIERIGAIRNELEHFYHGGGHSSVQEALADAAPVVSTLLSFLKLDPLGDLGKRWWEILLRNQQLFDAALSACRATLAQVRWQNNSAEAASCHLSCDRCHSPLLRQTDEQNDAQDKMSLRCWACGHEPSTRAAMAHAVEKQFYRELYEAHSRGGELPVVRCPECRFHSIVIEAGECVACGFTIRSDTSWCPDCDSLLSDHEVATSTHNCLRYCGPD